MLTFGPFDCTGTPESYAWGKARTAKQEGRDEGGPAIVIVDVPDDIVAMAVDEWIPLSQGFVQFDRGDGLEALRSAWPNLRKRVMPFADTKI